MSGLAGKKVLVTRPRHQADVFIEQLAGVGAVPVVFPTIEIVPCEDTGRLDKALQDLLTYDWIVFTSQNGVEYFWQRFGRLHPDPSVLNNAVQIAAIGPATAQALADRQVAVHYVPAEYVAEAVARDFPDPAGKRILLPRAKVARDVLVNELVRRGAWVDEIPVYQTVIPEVAAKKVLDLTNNIDVVTFTSSSTVHGFFKILNDRAAYVLNHAITVCIGPVTAAALQGYGFSPQLVASEYTTSGLFKALMGYLDEKQQKEKR